MGNNALWEKDKIIVFISKTQDVSVLLELGQSLWSSLTVYNYLTNYSYKLISQDLVLAQDPKILTKFIQKAQLRKNTKIFSLHPIICQKSVGIMLEEKWSTVREQGKISFEIPVGTSEGWKDRAGPHYLECGKCRSLN